MLKIKKILVHICCADCFLNTLNFLEQKSIINYQTQIYSLFYNPNIHPRSEYIERLNALKKVMPKGTKLIIPDYRPTEYFNNISQKTNRCENCWDLRIENLFKYAKDNNINHVTTTLLVSHYQNGYTIKKIANKYSKKYNINFVPLSDRYNLKHKGFYKQNYCGCCFSLTERLTHTTR